MKINYEPKDVYCPITQTDERYLVYGAIEKRANDAYQANQSNLAGIAKALVIKIMNESEKGLSYCCFGDGVLYAMSKSIWAAIKALRVEDYFYRFSQGGEIVCTKNKCSFYFMDSSKNGFSDRLRSIRGLKTVWMHVSDNFDEDRFCMINPAIREKESKIIFSFHTHACSDFLHGWFYNDFMRSLPKESVFIL